MAKQKTAIQKDYERATEMNNVVTSKPNNFYKLGEFEQYHPTADPEPYQPPIVSDPSGGPIVTDVPITMVPTIDELPTRDQIEDQAEEIRNLADQGGLAENPMPTGGGTGVTRDDIEQQAEEIAVLGDKQLRDQKYAYILNTPLSQLLNEGYSATGPGFAADGSIYKDGNVWLSASDIALVEQITGKPGMLIKKLSQTADNEFISSIMPGGSKYWWAWYVGAAVIIVLFLKFRK